MSPLRGEVCLGCASHRQRAGALRWARSCRRGRHRAEAADLCGILCGILALQMGQEARADAPALGPDSNPVLEEKQGIFGIRFGEEGASKALRRAGCDLVFNLPFSRLEERGERESPGMRTTIGKGVWKCDDSFNIRDQRVSASSKSSATPLLRPGNQPS